MGFSTLAKSRDQCEGWQQHLHLWYTETMSEKLLKNTDIEHIAAEGMKIYEAIKEGYEPDHNGKFLAIDIPTKQVYESNTSAEAVVEARKHHPDHVFYVIKVGFYAAETMAHLFPEK